MNILRIIIGFTTTATLAASSLNAGEAFAARIASNSTGCSIDCSSDISPQNRVARQTSATCKFENRAQKYEPAANGNPATSDGTGTR